jgi:hypothetical protein
MDVVQAVLNELLDVGLLELREQHVNSRREQRISIVCTLHISQQPYIAQAKGMTASHQCAT